MERRKKRKTRVDIETGLLTDGRGYGFIVWDRDYCNEVSYGCGFKDEDEAYNAAAARLDEWYGAGGWYC